MSALVPVAEDRGQWCVLTPCASIATLQRRMIEAYGMGE